MTMVNETNDKRRIEKYEMIWTGWYWGVNFVL